MKINITLKFLQTDRVFRIALISLFAFAISPIFCYSQDLYSLEQSRKYADYLYSSQQHVLAAEEYERLVFFENNNVTFRYRLIKSYRLSGNLNSGITRVHSFYPDSILTMPQSMASEFVKMLLLKDSLSVADKYIRQNKALSLEKNTIFQSCNLLLSGEYEKADLYVKQAVKNNLVLPSNIIELAEKAEKTRFKSPYLAAGFSAIIPGTGKFYTKNWSDGIFSLLFVASNAWQAYRGFNRDGIKSGYGWVFSGLTASFYIGNIFGSVKAVKRYNNIKKNEIEDQVYDFVRSDNF